MDDTAEDKERFRKLVGDLSDFMKDCEDSTSADVQKLAQLLQENQVLREMLSTAAISTPGIKQTFAKALAKWKAINQERMTNGVQIGSDDDSGTDNEMNKTMFEASAK
ncbi:unnamed protein product [Strongylus vulgaris]|uniref:Uncharacterized protein n=1 Tax=Strongylus vulgaris TaxID=40348 RepID=A0A3P7J125_STRVU|nr:unnamed protein product [Strongylus vulgaris]